MYWFHLDLEILERSRGVLCMSLDEQELQQEEGEMLKGETSSSKKFISD